MKIAFPLLHGRHNRSFSSHTPFPLSLVLVVMLMMLMMSMIRMITWNNGGNQVMEKEKEGRVCPIKWLMESPAQQSQLTPFILLIKRPLVDPLEKGHFSMNHV